MRCLWIIFVTAVCFLFLLKLKWPKNKNIYEGLFYSNILANVIFKKSAFVKKEIQVDGHVSLIVTSFLNASFVLINCFKASLLSGSEHIQ